MAFIQTRDQANLYVKTWGEGRPVFLIHGWPLCADTWDSVGIALAKDGYKAIAYDRRGFGRSDQPWQGYDYSTLADDLADVMEATGANQDAAIIGFSMGGGEVVRYMSRHEGRGVMQAGLISSIAPFMLKTSDNPNGVPEEKLNEIAANIKKDRPAFFKTFLKDFYGVGLLAHPVSDEILHWSWNMCMMAGLHPTLACAESFGKTDFRSEMAAVNVPTLIVHGTKDNTVPIDATGRQAAAAIRQAVFKEYDGAPHGLFITHEQQLINDIKMFLKS